jgi:hypothetical protein
MPAKPVAAEHTLFGFGFAAELQARSQLMPTRCVRACVRGYVKTNKHRSAIAEACREAVPQRRWQMNSQKLVAPVEPFSMAR